MSFLCDWASVTRRDGEGLSEGWPLSEGAPHGKGLQRSWEKEGHTGARYRTHTIRRQENHFFIKYLALFCVCMLQEIQCEKLLSFNHGKTHIFRESSICGCLISSCVMDPFNSVYT